MTGPHPSIACTIVVLSALGSLGCSPRHPEQPAATKSAQAESDAPAPLVLEDGVYPVILADTVLPEEWEEAPVVELTNVPVEGSEESTVETVIIFPRPLLRFETNADFSFTFAENECQEIGFRNTEELKVYTRDHVGSRLAVVVDNRVISHHKIREPLESDQVRITCCTVGGGDHLHRHLMTLQQASQKTAPPEVGE